MFKSVDAYLKYYVFLSVILSFLILLAVRICNFSHESNNLLVTFAFGYLPFIYGFMEYYFMLNSYWTFTDLCT